MNKLFTFFTLSFICLSPFLSISQDNLIVDKKSEKVKELMINFYPGVGLRRYSYDYFHLNSMADPDQPGFSSGTKYLSRKALIPVSAEISSRFSTPNDRKWNFGLLVNWARARILLTEDDWSLDLMPCHVGLSSRLKISNNRSIDFNLAGGPQVDFYVGSSKVIKLGAGFTPSIAANLNKFRIGIGYQHMWELYSFKSTFEENVRWEILSVLVGFSI